MHRLFTALRRHLFLVITSLITGIVFLLGILLLTRHLGDAYAFYRCLRELKPIPAVFSSLHLIALAVMVVLTFLLVFFGRHKNDLVVRSIVFSVWIIMVALEFIKQFMFVQIIEGEQLVYSYNWTFFPFQFCSMPYFILPFIAFLKNGKVRDAMILFFITFMLIGGLAGIGYPTFCEYTYINVHTLIHHGSMVMLAIYLAVIYRDKLNLRTLVTSFIPFAVMLVISAIINEIVWQKIPAVHSGVMIFNMFWFSPHFISSLPIFSSIQSAVPYPAFVVIYLLSCLIGTYLILIIYSLAINHQIHPCITWQKLKTKKRK